MSTREKALDLILEEEGFRSTAYPDPLSGADPYTFGHGLTWITEAESREIVRNRIASLEAGIRAAFEEDAWNRLGEVRQAVLVSMAYQMGLDGLMKFRKTLDFLRDGRWREAGLEALRSAWARQTPARAARAQYALEFGDFGDE